MSDAIPSLEPTTDPQPLSPALPNLERRVQRLEDALAMIQDTAVLEQRVVERLGEKLMRPTAEHRIIEATTRLLAAPEPSGVPLVHPARSLWPPFEMLAELRAMYRMFVDPRYHLGWRGGLVPLLLFLGILTSRIWIPGIVFLPEIIAQVIDKIVDLALAYVLFKLLMRESRRYREATPDLPANLRL